MKKLALLFFSHIFLLCLNVSAQVRNDVHLPIQGGQT